MSALFNLSGVLVVTLLSSRVAASVKELVLFEQNSRLSSIALIAAMLAIIIWSTAAWYFGIPTSESHALTAGLSGAAIALKNSFEGINKDKLFETLFGLVFSSAAGVLLGFLTARLIAFAFKNTNRQRTNRFFKIGQILSGSALSFMHGAQDGQKFVGVLLLGAYVSQSVETFNDRHRLMLIIYVSLLMALGTSLGGKRIIKTVGMDMVRLEGYQGFSADLACFISLLFPTLIGIPVSTTHTKTSAVIGVGASKRLSAIDLTTVKDMVIAWLLTFPISGFIGFCIAKLLFYVLL